MIKVQLKIGTVNNPVNGSSFITVNRLVSFEGGRFPKEKSGKNIFLRTKYSGSFKFLGILQRIIQDFIDDGDGFVEFRVIDIPDVLFSGKINLRGIIGEISETTSNTVEVIDEYTPFDLRGGNDINILNILPANNVIVPTAERFQVFEVSIPPNLVASLNDKFRVELGGDPYETLFDHANGEPWKKDTQTLLNYIENIIGGVGTWSLKRAEYSEGSLYAYEAFGSGTLAIAARLDAILAREIIDIPYVAGTVDPPFGPEWTFWGNVTNTGGVVLGRFVRPVQQVDSWDRSGTFSFDHGVSTFIQPNPIVVSSAIYLNTGINITGNSTVDYSRGRHVFKVIKELVRNIDDTLLFDETGNAPSDGIGGDSFYYFKNFTNSEGFKSLAKLQIMQLTDSIPGGNPLTEPSIGATKAMLDFNSFMDLWMERFKIDWFIEIRGEDKYFMTRHKTEQNFEVGTDPVYDTLTYKNNNWTEKQDDSVYNDDDKFFSAKFEDPISNNIDFIEQIVEFPKLEGIFTNQIDVRSTRFYFDTWHTQVNPDEYPGRAIKSFMIFSCEENPNGAQLIDSFVNNGFDSASGTFGNFTIEQGVLPGSANVDFTGSLLDDILPGESIGVFISLVVPNVSNPPLSLHMRMVFDGENTSLQQVVDGPQTFIFTAPDDFAGSISVQAFANAITELDVTFAIVVQKVDYDVVKTIGKISLEAIPNGSISIANVIEDHWLTDVPSNQVEANGKTIDILDIDLQKDEEITFAYPVVSGNEIESNKLMKTSKGNAELSKIVPDMDGGFSQITVKLIRN